MQILLSNTEQIKSILGEGDSFIHSKTGNEYFKHGIVRPVVMLEKAVINAFVAHCSENKDVEVVIYQHEDELVYVVSENLKLHENAEHKVLYEREGVFWLRSEYDFVKNVLINGVELPRFTRKNNIAS